MSTDPKAEFTTRQAILKLLSDDEIASVSTAESAASLAHGEEFIDLENLDHGVRSVDGENSLLGNVLPRKAVQEETWSKIVEQLAAS